MADYIPNILIDPKLINLADVSFVREDGEVNIMKTVDEKVLPFVTVGGDTEVFYDHATDKSEGTPISTYDTGEVTNPLHTKPSSFFTPTPQNVGTPFFGNPLFLANRTFLFGLLTVMKLLKGD